MTIWEALIALDIAAVSQSKSEVRWNREEVRVEEGNLHRTCEFKSAGRCLSLRRSMRTKWKSPSKLGRSDVVHPTTLKLQQSH